jgi:OPA family glycerol-3-phosphate transporter-like MFS transporter
MPTPANPKPHFASGVTRWHVTTVALLGLGYACYYFCRSDYSVALPLILAEQVGKGVPASVAQIRLGSIASLGVLAYAIGKFPSGGVADLFGGKRNFLGGMAGSILFTILFMLGGGFPLFTLAWIGNRFVQSLGWAGLVKVTSRWFSFSTYGTVMAILSLSYLFGDAASRELMSVLLAHGMGWRGLFLVGAGLLATIFLASLIFLRESPEGLGLPPVDENPLNVYAGGPAGTDPTVEAKPDQKGMVAILRPLLASRSFWLVCVLSLCATLLRETFNLWTPTYFTQVVGLSDSAAASSSALFPFAGGLAVILAGVLSDRLGPLGRGRILYMGLFLTAVALLFLAQVKAHGEAFVAVGLVALVAFLLIGPYSYLAGAMSLDFGGKQGCATASGIIDGVGYLAGVLSGNSMAHIAVSYGWQTMWVVLAAVAAFSGAVGAVAVWEQRRRARALHLQLAAA